PGLQPDLDHARPAAVAGLLPDERVLVRRVVPSQRVRARLSDRRRDGADHVQRHVRLRPADGEGRQRPVSAVTPIAPTPVVPVVPQRLSRRRRLGRVGWNVAGLAVFAVMIFPVYWMVSTAFKTGPNVITYSPKWLPIPATLANFGDAIHRPYFWQNVRNSLIVVSV